MLPLDADHLELMTVAGATSVLACAATAGLLDTLLEGPSSREQLAATLGLAPAALARVLDVLDALGLVEQRDAQVSLRERVHEAVRRAPAGSGELRIWQLLPWFLREGRALVDSEVMGSQLTRATVYPTAVRALAERHASAATHLAALLPDRPARVLDIGTGAGVWGLAVGQRHPDCRVVGLDLETVLPAFEERAAQLEMTDRVATLAGDYHAVELDPDGQPYDVVMLGNVLHLETPERARALLERAAKVLVPGGALVIIDCIATNEPRERLDAAVYALHLALRLPTGTLHSCAELEDWLAATGLTERVLLDVSDQRWPLRALVARRPAPARCPRG